MNARASCMWLSFSVLTLASRAVGDDPPPRVEVVHPVVREVSDFEDFTGRTETTASVRLVSRVTGFLDRVLFEDGDLVAKGDLLFEIDPRPYKAVVEKAEAGLALADARLGRADADHKRGVASFDRKTLSREELDRLTADRDEARARLQLATAVRDLARLDLAHTRVVAPLAGRISRRMIDRGNLARADETVLATLTAGGPMHVYFDIGERTALGLIRAGGKARGKGFRVGAGLADEKGFPRRAEVNHLDNRVDPTTGTLRLRATLPNADGVLVPGLFVRVRLTTGKPYKARLVPIRAVRSGRRSKPEGRFVFVVNEKDEVEERDVQLGSHFGDLVVVKEGLKTADRVVLDGQKKLKVGAKIEPKKVEMPTEKE